MVMAMAASNHKDCGEYFAPLHQALAIVMQKVYRDIDGHNGAFIVSGYVQPWDRKLKKLAEARWIDTIFGISALMSISTQLSYCKSMGSLCKDHGTPFLKLVEAATSNIAVSVIQDSQLHLASIHRKTKEVASNRANSSDPASYDDEDSPNVLLSLVKFRSSSAASSGSNLRRESDYIGESKEVISKDKDMLLEYFQVINTARHTVERNSSNHSVEMVFSQFAFLQLIKNRWLTKVVA
jgi:hypothetical protein